MNNLIVGLITFTAKRLNMKELLLSIWEGFNERLKNPVVFALLAAWTAWNWEAIMILFCSELEIESVIKTIGDNYVSPSKNYVGPMVTALVYLFGMPWFLWFFDFAVTIPNNKRSMISLTAKAAKIRLNTDVVRAEVELELARTNHSVAADLKVTNDKLQKELIESKSSSKFEIQKLKEQFSKLEKERSVKAANMEKNIMASNENLKLLVENFKLQKGYIQEYYAMRLVEGDVGYEMLIRALNEVRTNRTINVGSNGYELLKKYYLVQERQDKKGEKFLSLTKKGEVFWDEECRKNGADFVGYPNLDELSADVLRELLK